MGKVVRIVRARPPVSREEAAKRLIDWVDRVADGELGPEPRIKPIGVKSPSGNRAVVLVISEEAWTWLFALLRETGHEELLRLVQ